MTPDIIYSLVVDLCQVVVVDVSNGISDVDKTFYRRGRSDGHTTIGFESIGSTTGYSGIPNTLTVTTRR